MSKPSSPLLIRRKIRFAILSTAAAGVLIISLVFAAYMTAFQWNRINDDIRIHARRTGISCIFSLIFDDPRDAEDALKNLDVLSSVDAAAIYRKDGELFTQYSRSGIALLPNVMDRKISETRSISSKYLVVTEPIISGAERIGYVSIAYSMKEFYRTLLYSLAAVMFGLVMAQWLAYVIGRKFQQTLSMPIEELSATARRVADTGDYTVRAKEQSSDEIGQLAKDFNKMLTEVQARDNELLSSEHRFRALVDQAVDIILLIRQDGQLVDCNPLAIKTLQMDRAQLLALRVQDVIPSFDPAMFSKLWEDAISKTHLIATTSLQCKDQTSIPVEIKLGLLRQRDETLLVAFCRDISLRIEAAEKLKSTEERLHQSQKMDSIGRLAGGIAHDFNNMLMGILGAAELLQLYTEGERSKQYLDMILSSVNQASELTEKLLVFSRKKDVGFVPFDIQKCVHDALVLLRHSVDPRIQITEKYEASSPVVAGESSLIQNVVLNLGVNARDAISERGDITVSVTNTLLDEKDCQKLSFKLEPGEYVRIDVQDTGSGIPPDIQKKIFEPFFTTKEVGKGTGMGLSVAYGTINDHHGALSVESREGEGSTFTILLPVSDVAIAAADQTETEPSSIKSANILLIDDEPVVRVSMAEYLGQQGHTVIEAEDGEEGLQKYRENPKGIDLVILDVLMPRMNGADCFREMKKICPDVKAIMISGYTKDASISALKTNGVLEVISKPFSPKALLQTIAKVLNPSK